ncbi:MAG TPA: hypothetical protein VK190_04415 [Pseudoneobacillus sp.]|nr:hypothetical protein [Pseudoneobacillus sp.]
MLEQFIKSILARFVQYEPMNAYIQNIPEGVEYPCYLLNKCDIHTTPLNSFYFVNNVTLYVRIFGTDEIDLKNRVFNLTNNIFEYHRKIPILNQDGTESNRFLRIEDVESIEIPVDENEVYCIELNFNFDTTHQVSVQEFELLARVLVNNQIINSNLEFKIGG